MQLISVLVSLLCHTSARESLIYMLQVTEHQTCIRNLENNDRQILNLYIPNTVLTMLARWVLMVAAQALVNICHVWSCTDNITMVIRLSLALLSSSTTDLNCSLIARY